MKTSDPPIVVEQILNTDINNVWKAITELSQLKEWFFDNIPEYKAEEGFTCRFDIKSEERQFPHVWKITTVVPPKKLVTNWTFDGYAGETLVHFDLADLGAKTKFQISTEVLKDFPDDVPEFKRESGLAGWEYFANRLKEYIDSKFAKS